jgi:hypothetical protein
VYLIVDESLEAIGELLVASTKGVVTPEDGKAIGKVERQNRDTEFAVDNVW